jgi:hypothetical protein
MEPGIFETLSFAEYAEIDAVNASTLVAASKTLAHCLVDKEDTPGMRLGRAFHALTLQPVVWKYDWCVLPEKMTRRCNAWKEFKAANEGKEILSIEEMSTIRSMRASLDTGKYETARNLIEGCDKRELTLVWKHKKWGCLCKARLDGYSSSLNAIVDLKTGQTADPEKWVNIGLRAGGKPHWQVAWYLQGVRETLDPECKTFLWILFETKAPYGISVVKATPPDEGESDMAYLAEIEMEPILKRYLEAKSRGV